MWCDATCLMILLRSRTYKSEGITCICLEASSLLCRSDLLPQSNIDNFLPIPRSSCRQYSSFVLLWRGHQGFEPENDSCQNGWRQHKGHDRWRHKVFLEAYDHVSSPHVHIVYIKVQVRIQKRHHSNNDGKQGR
jgi:hypothetical protein